MKQTEHHIRAFIAAVLPEPVKAFLVRLQKDLKKDDIRASWPRPETMHLTLKFLGDVPEDQIQGIQFCMADAVKHHTRPIILSAGGIGVFPSVKNTRVVWCGVGGQTHHLATLARELNRGLKAHLGLKQEKKRFSPHFTLARIIKKQRVPPEKMVALMQKFSNRQSENFDVSQIKLFKSELKSTGAVHTELFSISIL